MVSDRVEEFRIGPDPRAVPDLRHAVRRICSDAGLPADTCDIAVLLTSETLTNAIVHAGTSILLAVRVSLGGVRVEVTDDNSCPPIAALPGTDERSWSPADRHPRDPLGRRASQARKDRVVRDRLVVPDRARRLAGPPGG